MYVFIINDGKMLVIIDVVLLMLVFRIISLDWSSDIMIKLYSLE